MRKGPATQRQLFAANSDSFNQHEVRSLILHNILDVFQATVHGQNAVISWNRRQRGSNTTWEDAIKDHELDELYQLPRQTIQL